MNGIVGLRIIIHAITTITLLVAIVLMTTAVNTTGWQTFTDPDGEIHQHGLWLDYTYQVQHLAGSGGNQKNWVFKYKFGSSVDGDELHRAQEYQINTLVLLCVATLLGIVGLGLSYCGFGWVIPGVAWCCASFIASSLCAAGLTLFYLATMEPKQRYVNTEKGKVEQTVSYSFYLAVYSTILFAVSTVLALVCTILLCFTGRISHDTARTFPQMHHKNTNV